MLSIAATNLPANLFSGSAKRFNMLFDHLLTPTLSFGNRAAHPPPTLLVVTTFLVQISSWDDHTHSREDRNNGDTLFSNSILSTLFWRAFQLYNCISHFTLCSSLKTFNHFLHCFIWSLNYLGTPSNLCSFLVSCSIRQLSSLNLAVLLVNSLCIQYRALSSPSF